jgi:hypothetical protein
MEDRNRSHETAPRHVAPTTACPSSRIACSKLNSTESGKLLCSLLASPACLSHSVMVINDHAEERLARVERMLAQCRRQNAAINAVAASKVAVIVVNAAPPLGVTDSIRPARVRRSYPR